MARSKKAAKGKNPFIPGRTNEALDAYKVDKNKDPIVNKNKNE